MVDTPTRQRWIGRGSFLLLCFALVFFHLLPLSTMPPRWAPPDFLLALTLAWTVRRSDLVPVGSVAVVFFLTDMLFQRPPGLMTALVLLVTEGLRARSASMRTLPFPLEWLTVSFAIVGLVFLNRAALLIVMADRAPLTPTVIQMVMTILAYPLVVALSYLIFGVHRPAQGEVDAFGRPV